MCRAGTLVQSIEIDVIKLHSPGIRIHQCEGRAGDVILGDTQCGADTFDENSLTGAQWTTQQQDLSAFESCSNLMTVVERRLWR